jgi:hypothetical protein
MNDLLRALKGATTETAGIIMLGFVALTVLENGQWLPRWAMIMVIFISVFGILLIHSTASGFLKGSDKNGQ